MKKTEKYEYIKRIIKENKHLDNKTLVRMLIDKYGFTIGELMDMVDHSKINSEVDK